MGFLWGNEIQPITMELLIYKISALCYYDEY